MCVCVCSERKRGEEKRELSQEMCRDVQRRGKRGQVREGLAILRDKKKESREYEEIEIERKCVHRWEGSGTGREIGNDTERKTDV